MNPSLRIIRSMPVFLLVFLLSACESRADFSYSDGSTGNYGQFAGKWLLINYWADWCKPCIKEIPELNAFASQHANVVVIGVNYDILPVAEEQAIVKKLDIRFPVIRTHIHQHYSYDMPLSLPTTIVINPEGKVHNILKGPQTTESLTQAISL